MEEIQLKYTEAISVLEGKSKEVIRSQRTPCTREKLIDIVFSLKDIFNDLFTVADKADREVSIIENTTAKIAGNCVDIITQKIEQTLPGMVKETIESCDFTNKMSFSDVVKSGNNEEAFANIAKNAVSYHNKELVDRKNRCCNLMVFNVDETLSDENAQVKDDEKFLKEICENTLKLSNLKFKKVSRVGQKKKVSTENPSPKPRPIKIVFESETDKDSCLKNAFKLQEANQAVKKISLSHDLTSLQRDELHAKLSEARSKNDEEKAKNSNVVWKVRGQPGNYYLKEFQTRG